MENNPALPAPAGLFEGIETCEQLLSSVQQAEISRIMHTTAHLDQHEQFIREYVIAAPSRDESSAVLEKLNELSTTFQGEEYASLRDAIHDLFDYRDKYKIIRIIHSLGESRTKWYQTFEVYDAAEVTAVEDESGRLRSFRPAGTDMPEFSPRRPIDRYSAIMALHAADDEASREAAAIELRKLPPRKQFKKPDPPAFPAGTPENPAG